MTTLRLQRHVAGSGDRILIADDWAETASKARTARALIDECGGEYAGLSLLVDQLADDVRRELVPVERVVYAHELGA